MNKILRKIFFVLFYPLSPMIRMVQNKMDFLRNYKLKLLIAKVLRFIRIIKGTTASVQFPDTLHPSSNSSFNRKIGFIDHSYHYKTASPSFFIEMLIKLGSVRVMWDSQWNGGKFRSIQTINEYNFDILILWQIMIYHDPEKLKKIGCKNIIIIPMYDDIHSDPDKLFLRFREFRFLSFSNALHRRLDALGIRSKYVQYYIDTNSIPYKEDNFSELRGFFWQRTNDITWEHIRKLIEEARFSSFHIHLALDPIWYREVLPSEEDLHKYNITITRWFEKKEDYLSVLSEANIFFTPRLYEGIGMTILESMSMGKVVVAPDHPAVNEYITHGKNGLLYDVNNLKPINFSQVQTIAVQARRDSILGFENWNDEQAILLEWIANQ